MADVHLALDSLSTFVTDLENAASGKPTHSAALRTLAEYGKRWQALAICEVPLDQPFVVTSQREVPFKVARSRPWASQEVDMRDARSNHIALRVDDENVEVATVELNGVDGKRLEQTLVNGLRSSRERYSIYASEPDRDRRAILNFRLKVPLSVRIASTTIHTITWLAVALVAMLIHRHTLTAADLAVLVVPTTFGAALFLTRERTSLARRLQWLTRIGTPLAVAALWIVVATAYVCHHVNLNG